MKFAVIGLGQFGSRLAIELSAQGHEVIAADCDEKIVDEVKSAVDFAVIADATDRKALEELSLQDLDGVFVAIGEDFATSLTIVAHLQELGVHKIHCRVINPIHEKLLRLLKVEHLVQAETLAARQLAKRMGIHGATRHFGLTEDHAIVELRAPAFLAGKRLGEVDLRRKYGINLVTVRRQRSESKSGILGVPHPDLIFEEKDELVVFGTEETIKHFSKTKR